MKRMTMADVKALKKKPGRYRVAAKSERTIKDQKYGEITFDSRAELERFKVLRQLEDNDQIALILMQVPFRLPGGVIYRLDFLVFFEPLLGSADRFGRISFEDVKGHRTEVYRIKKRQVEALYGITITEIDAKQYRKKRTAK